MTKKLISIFFAILMCLGVMCACVDPEAELEYEDRLKTTEDGFVYLNDKKIGGVCIVGIPDSEEIVIPEFIDGQPVKQMGYAEKKGDKTVPHYVDGEHVKKLTFQHRPNCLYMNFSNLSDIVYVDFVSMNTNVIAMGGLRVPDSFWYATMWKVPNVELKKGDKQVKPEEIKLKAINIPMYVKKIDSGVFAGLDGVILRTPYESKPEGWQDGWNGDCEVEWGADIETYNPDLT